MKTQYAVMVIGKNNPQKLHDNYESALEEAKRLSTENRCESYVLQTVTKIEVTNVVVTEIIPMAKNTKPTAEERFREIWTNCVKNSDYYIKDGEKLFYQDDKNKILWADYPSVWEVFEIEFSMKYVDIQSLIRSQIEKDDNLNGFTPKFSIHHIDWR